MSPLQLPPWFGLAITSIVCGSAFWKGGREEQLAAGALLLSWVATILFRDRSWAGTQWAGFLIDIAFLVVLMAIAMTSRRYWPLPAAAFQLLGVVTHAARIVDQTFAAWAYATAGIIWTQLVLLAMAIGVWGAWRRASHPAKAGDPSDVPGATRR